MLKRRRKVTIPRPVEQEVVAEPTAERPKNFGKRRGSDFLTRAITFFVLADWVAIISAFIFLDLAVPQKGTFFAGTWGKNIRPAFYPEKLAWVLGLLTLGFLVSLIGLLINASRHRRKEDYYRKSLIILCIFSFAGMIAISAILFMA